MVCIFRDVFTNDTLRVLTERVATPSDREILWAQDEAHHPGKVARSVSATDPLMSYGSSVYGAVKFPNEQYASVLLWPRRSNIVEQLVGIV
jgi:hypothetical protein